MTAPYSGRFQRLITSVTPWYVAQRFGGGFLQAVGKTLDLAEASVFDMVRASRPLLCDSDALPAISRERGIRLYPSEPEASMRVRLSRWRQLHKRRGTHRGELEHLQPYFLPGTLPMLRIVHQAGDGSCATWHTLDPLGAYSVHRATGSNWNWDNVTPSYSRFWLIAHTAGTRLDGGSTNWDGGGAWDGGGLWDGRPNAAEIDDIVSAIRDWQSAHSVLWGVIITRDASALDPTGSAVANADGSTTYPQGNWWNVIDMSTGKPTRPSGIRVVYNLGHG